ncbi:sacsin-like [Megalops cyprinoides]|uniref:sacsin-like n=1 Tax=Megalops cyprinoides TaxID=118141 RepID=UPI00186507BA|nr:sacsin-like [Megalops cyprinoides]
MRSTARHRSACGALWDLRGGRSESAQNAFAATSPPFIDYLKDILRRYPDGGQILKELIQNADDAGATEVVFIHDERAYESQALWTDLLQKYQGPALYAFNNAEFTEQDWSGIQATGRSVKRNDPNKVGRFGIGFNSVYHVTDLPCIFSGKYFAMMDPQEKIFGEGNGGFRWSLCDEEERETLLLLQDQFQPFRDIVGQVSGHTWEDAVGEDQHFSGTLFRFPLRNDPSEISENLYYSEKVVQLFDSFIADADLSLLFLRNVASVALMHIDSNGSVNVRLKAAASSPAVNAVFVPRTDSAAIGSTHFKIVSTSCGQRAEAQAPWLVTACCMAEGKVPALDLLAEKLSFLPLVHVAFPLDQDKALTDGRLSCFLPLPNNESNRTGLPVHVNACFGLTDNRRHIKWQEEDQRYDEAAQWNELLVKEVLPHAYHMLILDAIHLSRRSDAMAASTVYHSWPDIVLMKHKAKWQEIAMDMLQHLLQLSVLSLARDENEWVKPTEALFFPDGNMDPQVRKAVADLLISEGEKLVFIPPHVSRAIQRAFRERDSLSWVTPGFVRDVLRKTDLRELSRGDKLLLLEYVLEDGKYQHLSGLQLLPVSDGTFRSFINDAENLVLIDTDEFPRVLLPMFKGSFLHKDIRSSVLDHIKQLTQTRMYKIFFLDTRRVGFHAKSSLPEGWRQSHGHVTWEIGSSLQPPVQWLKAFWNFLRVHATELNSFIEMPLIPLEPIHETTEFAMLARLQENSTLMFQNGRYSSLPSAVAETVAKLGGTVIQRRDECLQHQDLETYVLSPSPQNVLRLFLNLGVQHVIGGMDAASLQEREELKSYFSSLASVSAEGRWLLSSLPLFRPMPSLSGGFTRFLSAQSTQAVILNCVPALPTDLLMPDTVIQCSTEADRRLLSLLNVRLLNTAQATVVMVNGIQQGLYQREDANNIMTWLLHHGNILFSMEEALYLKCKNMCFTETQGGQHKKASDLFDPDNSTFQALFDSDCFPPPLFTRTRQMLESLQRLGLKTRETDVRPNDVLHVAMQIESSRLRCWESAMSKAEALIGLCNQTDVLSKFSEEQIMQLSSINWFPCNIPEFLNGAHEGKTQRKSFYKPNDVRHSRFSPIVGHVMPLAYSDEVNHKPSLKLGLLRPPPAYKVFENLSALKSMVSTMHDPDTNAHFREELHSMYRFMQDNVAHFKQIINDKNMSWLWIKCQFVSPCNVVLVYPPEIDLTSYIDRVPDDFLQYSKLLTEFGAKASLADREVEEILHRIKHRIDKRHPSHGTPSELKVAIAILNWMRRGKKPYQEDLPVPVMAENQEFSLQPLSAAVFCDITEEGLEDLREEHEVFHVVHEEIPRATADWLKVPFLSTQILKPEFIGIQQCGQTEPITRRIKNILKEYDEEHDLFKELIQNAEDAGANTCRFMVDFRKHRDPPESLIDQGMSVCHGACLWSFNDELLTEEDWDNITKVGSASKEKKVEKIGKFGIGFNAVYHVTDIPSVLSGKTLLIFDPNVTHLKKHILNKAIPGIKLDLNHERLFRTFPGQFKPYEGVFECNLSRNTDKKFYQGTLIKLPFRTQEEAETSEMSKKVYEGNRIVTFQRKFIQNSDNLLLFLKNISEISLQMLPETACTPPNNEDINTLLKVSRKVVRTVNIPDDNHLIEIQRYSVSVLISLDEKYQGIVDWHAANIIEMTKEQMEESEVRYWLLYSCFGLHTVCRMYQVREAEQRGRNAGIPDLSLPVGGVAIPLRKDQTQKYWIPDKADFLGETFSFLPLSIGSGLPVHVNGCFAVTSNRKSLWDTGAKHEWNQSLLKDSVTISYITAMLVLKKMSQAGEIREYDYYAFWPDKEKVSKPFESLATAFYTAIAGDFFGTRLELFSDGENWCALENARFLHPDIEKNKRIGPVAMHEFLHKLQKPELPVALPKWVRKSFILAGFEKAVEERTFDWVKFYQEVVFKNLKAMESKNRNALVLHAIDRDDEAIDALLKQHPCIPTQGGQQLQFIGKVVNPQGKVACLYEAEEGRLLEGTVKDFLSPKRMSRLSELGMLEDCLPFSELAERAKRIATVWKQNKEKAYACIQCILGLASHFLNDSSSPHWKSLKEVTFIPAQLPSIITEGKNDMVALRKPTEIYRYECRHLVCLTEPIVDQYHLLPSFTHCHDAVLSKLGVTQEPLLKTVLSQLKVAWQHSAELPEHLILEITTQCYRWLDRFLQNPNSKCISSSVRVTAQHFPFVFIERAFVSVSSVARNVEFDGRPYLFELPKALSRFNHLWKCVGIKQMFTSTQYLNILQDLNTKYNGSKLSEADLKLCLQVVINGLYKTHDDNLREYHLPDESGVLRLSGQLRYNDTKWLSPPEGVILCHDLIPRGVAVQLKVKTTRHHTLENHLVETFSPFDFKEFEQKEKLTVRLKNIIAAYPSKKDILKELIQNADDAEATEIHFVWDCRKHDTTKTFGEKWNPLQGPALCVYNNKVFSDVDLNGIQQLGEGGKHSNPQKTGKYGLGFNSVYHLTDCPSILTGDKWLCISDPNMNFLESEKRGCMYSVTPQFIQLCKDVYDAHLPSFFPLGVGTMFRLPIRTGEMAQSSEISNKEVTIADIQEIYGALAEDPEGLILFLRNVKKIQFHTITPVGRAFCCLPLPGKTGLPVHVNGNFEVDASRRDLWKEDCKSMKTEWNEFLKLRVIAPLYADLLDYIRSNILKIQTQYLSLDKLGRDLHSSYLAFFPHISSDVAQEWQGMIHRVYQSINDRELRMMPVLHILPPSVIRVIGSYSVSWSCISAADPAEAPHFTGEHTESLHRTLEGIGMKLIPFSQSMNEISNSFQRAGIEVRKVSPVAVRNYLKQRGVSDPQKTEEDLPLSISQTLVKDKMTCQTLLDYCMGDISKRNSDSVCGLPLLLTQDQVLRSFEARNPKFLSRFVCLFEGSESIFAEYDTNCNHFDVLKHSNFLRELTVPVSAKYLNSVLKTLLQNCEVDPKSSLYIPDEDFCKWLKMLWMYIEDQIRITTTKDRKSNQVFSDTKRLFSDSPIVPVLCPTQNNRRLLDTMAALSSIVFMSLEDVAGILFKLGFMKLDTSFFSIEILQCHIIPGQLNASDRGAVLQQLYERQNLPFNQLKNGELNQLLSFLLPGLKGSRNPKDYERKLKSLPLFETIERTRQSIDGYRRAFIFNTELMGQFPDLYFLNDDTVFLRYNATNLALSNEMHINVVNDVEFFVDFILPSLNKLTEAQVLNSVRMLLEIQQNYSEYIKHKNHILSILRRIPFIKDIFGKLQMASYFFDEEENIYQVMLPQERFIPTEFWNIMGCKRNRLKNLLKELGLKHVVSDEELIQFAQQIEVGARGTAPLATLKHRSAVLLETVLIKNQKEMNPAFLRHISRIQFIFPQQIQEELCKYHRPYAGERDTVAMQGSLIERDSRYKLLIWTSMPVLPSDNITAHHSEILRAGGAVNQPPTERVIENLKNICTASCQTFDHLHTRLKVFYHSYAFLQEMDFDAGPLRELPVVLVEEGAALVKPGHTVLMVHNAVEFRPYLYKLPPRLALYIDFFHKIGVAETPSGKHYSSVLKEIHRDSTNKQTLNPNQMKTVKRTVEQLFLLLKEKPQQMPKLSPPLHLPATDGRLYESSTLYFNNTSFQPRRFEDTLKQKLKLLEKLSKCHLGTDCYEHQKLVQLLPSEVRPHLLSELMTEDLLQSSVKLCEYRERCEFRECFERHLTSPSFLHGLVCLIRHQCRGTVSESAAVSMCQSIFSRIQITCCEVLETVLLLKLEPLADTAAETQVYVKRDAGVCTFYLKHSNDLTVKVRSQINKCLTTEINVLLNTGLNSDSLLILSQLLCCDTMQDVNTVLESQGIQDSSAGESCHSGLPDPGTPIPDEWIDFLDMDFLNNFEKGEYVGFKRPSLEDEVYCYAFVVDRLDASSNQGGPASCRYKIQTGPDELIEVSALDLYQFKRAKRLPSAENTCRDLVLLENIRQTSPPPPNRAPLQSLEEIKEEIDRCLRQIWPLPEEEKRKAIRRLYLKWHPDKNPECVHLATEAYKYLKKRIQELEQGKMEENRSSGYRGFFQQWDQEASRHRRARATFQQHFSSQEHSFWAFHRGARPRPDREEAQRWLRQGQCDLSAARKDTGGGATEWCLFKVHQAVEKALTAAEYRKTGQQPTDCTIASLAQRVSRSSAGLGAVPSMVSRLRQLGVDAKRTQYPSYHPSPYIPNECFNSQDETKVLDLADELLTLIKAYISE